MTLPYYRFVGDTWEIAEPAIPSPPVPLKLVTWNIWFGEHEQKARRTALLAELERRSPDVIVLQEVTSRQLDPIVGAPWVRARYQVSDFEGTTFERYGVLLLSRIPLRKLDILDLPTKMERRLLVAELSCGLTVATVHLESTSLCAATRATQLRIIQPYLAASSPDVVLAGDMNFKPDAEAENAALDPSFVDVWPAVRGDEPGYTVDSSINLMQHIAAGKQSHKRIDRVFLRSRAWAPRTAELLGVTPIDADDNFVSDHFGLEVDLVPSP